MLDRRVLLELLHLPMASERTDWKVARLLRRRLDRRDAGRHAIGGMGYGFRMAVIGKAMAVLFHKVDGVQNHVFDGGHGRHVAL